MIDIRFTARLFLITACGTHAAGPPVAAIYTSAISSEELASRTSKKTSELLRNHEAN
jgi:hypothetical protein